MQVLSSFVFTVSKVFISGPVVVSPSTEFRFKAVFPRNSDISQASWMRIQNHTSTKMSVEETQEVFCGYPQTQSVKIPNLPENFGAYQLSLQHMRSNIINVFPYGNCLV